MISGGPLAYFERRLGNDTGPTARGSCPGKGDRGIARPVRVGERVKQGRSANDLGVYAPEGVSDEVEDQPSSGPRNFLRGLRASPPQEARRRLPFLGGCTVLGGHVSSVGRHSVLERGGTDARVIGAANALAKIERASQTAMASFPAQTRKHPDDPGRED
jgi:hypothetical protein